MNTKYDYIICGAGLAGLSMAIRLAEDRFSGKKILIVDRDEKIKNDRTWSFWQLKDEKRFDSIYHKTWDQLYFHGPDFSKQFDIAPYQYRTIKGIDFYNHAKEILGQCNHIDFQLGDVSAIRDQGQDVLVEIDQEKYKTNYVFDSIVRKFPEEDKFFVWQHFLGWEIEAIHGNFDADVATFMDFRIEQKGEVRFVYVLPWSNEKALVEATLFSKNICESHIYEEILVDYMSSYLPDIQYKILDKEVGAIPMTTMPFSKGSQRVIPIGTNNGTVKPSSGYAFVRIQEECDELITRIEKGVYKRVKRSRKFKAYDRTLLNVILTDKVSGQKAFSEMFRNNDPVKILKFLNEKTSIIEEAGFFKSLPIWPFTKAFMQEIGSF